MICADIRKISEFLSENFHFFLVVKISIYLNRRVFIMLFAQVSVLICRDERVKQTFHPDYYLYISKVLDNVYIG